MLLGAMLSIIEQAGIDVLTLTEGLEIDEFLQSRLTRMEVRRKVDIISDTVAHMPTESKACLPEIDWEGWRACSGNLTRGGLIGDDALWFAVRSLIPATLTWLRIYRHNQPKLFEMTL